MARRAHKLSDNRGRERLSSVARPRHPGAGGRRLELSRLAPHEHEGMNDRGRDLKVDIHDHDRLSRSELRVLWAQELGERPPATLGRDVLALGIAYTRQERRHGGLSKPVDKELARLFDQVLRGDRTETPAALTAPLPRSGTILVREWQGTAPHVTVTEDGFLWNGRTYQSLSGIARAITGTNWNEPRFFGMREVNVKMPQTRRDG